MENYILSCCSTMDLRKGWAEERGVNLIYAKFFLEGEEFRDDFYESISQDKLFERMLSGEKSQTTQVNTELQKIFRAGAGHFPYLSLQRSIRNL